MLAMLPLEQVPPAVFPAIHVPHHIGLFLALHPHVLVSKRVEAAVARII
jgi:hypothetical protein